MRTSQILKTPVVAVLLVAAGCKENPDDRLARMAERSLDRQAEQNQQMADLQKQVAQGSRELVEADAEARRELAELQTKLQNERSEIGRQRDRLETDRKELARQRRNDPIIAQSIAAVGWLLVASLPLILAWHLLRRPAETADDQAVAETLIEDLVLERPLLLTCQNDQPRLPLLGKEPDAGDNAEPPF